MTPPIRNNILTDLPIIVDRAVANLLLARSVTRRQEMVVRGALGARPTRLIRQLLTESLVLGLAGGALGVGLAFLGLRALAGAFPVGEAIREFLVVDRWALVFALATSIATSLAFGVVPALQAARPDLRGALNEGGRGVGFGAQPRLSTNVTRTETR